MAGEVKDREIDWESTRPVEGGDWETPKGSDEIVRADNVASIEEEIRIFSMEEALSESYGLPRLSPLKTSGYPISVFPDASNGAIGEDGDHFYLPITGVRMEVDWVHKAYDSLLRSPSFGLASRQGSELRGGQSQFDEESSAVLERQMTGLQLETGVGDVSAVAAEPLPPPPSPVPTTVGGCSSKPASDAGEPTTVSGLQLETGVDAGEPTTVSGLQLETGVGDVSAVAAEPPPPPSPDPTTVGGCSSKPASNAGDPTTDSGLQLETWVGDVSAVAAELPPPPSPVPTTVGGCSSKPASDVGEPTTSDAGEPTTVSRRSNPRRAKSMSNLAGKSPKAKKLERGCTRAADFRDSVLSRISKIATRKRNPGRAARRHGWGAVENLVNIFGPAVHGCAAIKIQNKRSKKVSSGRQKRRQAASKGLSSQALKNKAAGLSNSLLSKDRMTNELVEGIAKTTEVQLGSGEQTCGARDNSVHCERPPGDKDLESTLTQETYGEIVLAECPGVPFRLETGALVESPSLRPRAAWVLCDLCEKWRRIPPELADIIGQKNRKWTCKENEDKMFADCSIPQEKTNEVINAELNLSDGEDYCHAQLNSGATESSERPGFNPDSYTKINSNLFLHRNRKTQTSDEIMVCTCKPPLDGRLGCGEECLNRILNIECVKGFCPCGDLCSNQQFQKRKYAKFERSRCGKKGHGLQLQENVYVGQFLIEYVGEVLDLAAYETRQRTYASMGQKHFYFMTLNAGEVIDACCKGNLGRFINHSCDPNCQTEKWMVNGEVCIGLFAIRNIKKGEEVTFNYQFVPAFGAAAKKCFCGAANCRGYIGPDPSDAEAIVQADSDEEYPQPLMIQRPVGQALLLAGTVSPKVDSMVVDPVDLPIPSDAKAIVQTDSDDEYPEQLMIHGHDEQALLLAGTVSPAADSMVVDRVDIPIQSGGTIKVHGHGDRVLLLYGTDSPAVDSKTVDHADIPVQSEVTKRESTERSFSSTFDVEVVEHLEISVRFGDSKRDLGKNGIVSDTIDANFLKSEQYPIENEQPKRHPPILMGLIKDTTCRSLSDAYPLGNLKQTLDDIPTKHTMSDVISDAEVFENSSHSSNSAQTDEAICRPLSDAQPLEISPGTSSINKPTMDPLVLDEKSHKVEVKLNISKPSLPVKSSKRKISIKKACPIAHSEKTESAKQVPTKISKGHTERVEEKLDKLLDEHGGISNRRGACKVYLKLLFVTAAEGDNFRGYASQSTRDLSLILDALLKTKSNAVLADIISKNGLQMLHNIMKQNRSKHMRIPIIRKLLKVLEFLEQENIVTRELIIKSPCSGEESFEQSMLMLTRHEDNTIHTMARRLRDKWNLRTIRRSKESARVDGQPSTQHFYCNWHQSSSCKCRDQATAVHGGNSLLPSQQASTSVPLNNYNHTSGTRIIKPEIRWGQPSGVRSLNPESLWPVEDQTPEAGSDIVKSTALSVNDEAPPGFQSLCTNVQPENTDVDHSEEEDTAPPGFECLMKDHNPHTPSEVEVVVASRQERYLSNLTVSYGIPAALVQQLGTPGVDSGSQSHPCWAVAPGIPFHPFPPLPPYPRGKPDPASSDHNSRSNKFCSSSRTGLTVDTGFCNPSFTGRGNGWHPFHGSRGRYVQNQRWGNGRYNRHFSPNDGSLGPFSRGGRRQWDVQSQHPCPQQKNSSQGEKRQQNELSWPPWPQEKYTTQEKRPRNEQSLPPSPQEKKTPQLDKSCPPWPQEKNAQEELSRGQCSRREGKPREEKRPCEDRTRHGGKRSREGEGWLPCLAEEKKRRSESGERKAREEKHPHEEQRSLPCPMEEKKRHGENGERKSRDGKRPHEEQRCRPCPVEEKKRQRESRERKLSHEEQRCLPCPAEEKQRWGKSGERKSSHEEQRHVHCPTEEKKRQSESKERNSSHEEQRCLPCPAEEKKRQSESRERKSWEEKRPHEVRQSESRERKSYEEVRRGESRERKSREEKQAHEEVPCRRGEKRPREDEHFSTEEKRSRHEKNWGSRAGEESKSDCKSNRNKKSSHGDDLCSSRIGEIRTKYRK